MLRYERIKRHPCTHTLVAVLCDLAITDFYTQFRRSPAVLSAGHWNHDCWRPDHDERCWRTFRYSARGAGLLAASTGDFLNAGF